MRVRTVWCIVGSVVDADAQAGLFATEPEAAADVLVINDRCVVRVEGDLRIVVAAGVPLAHFVADDRMAAAYAMVSLIEQGWADQNDDRALARIPGAPSPLRAGDPQMFFPVFDARTLPGSDLPQMYQRISGKAPSISPVTDDPYALLTRLIPAPYGFRQVIAVIGRIPDLNE